MDHTPMARGSLGFVSGVGSGSDRVGGQNTPTGTGQATDER